MADPCFTPIWRRGRCLIVAVAVLSTVAGTAGLSGPAGAGASTDVEFIPFHSDKAMDVFQASNLPGTPIVQWTQNNGMNQRWQVLEFGDSSLYMIRSALSGLVLDVRDGSTDSGAALTQTAWAASLSQLWLLLPFGDTGYYVVANINSGKVADVSGASTADGAPFIQWPWRGGLNQIFFLESPEVAPT